MNSDLYFEKLQCPSCDRHGVFLLGEETREANQAIWKCGSPFCQYGWRIPIEFSEAEEEE